MRKRNVGWFSFLVLAGASVGFALSLSPWRKQAKEEYKASTVRSELDQAERAKAELIHRKASLESPAGQEERARELGYQRPNEVRIDVGN